MSDVPALHEDGEWPYVRTLLPRDLDASARELDALVRCRNVPDAAALMRLALAYAVSDLSLKDVAAWASALHVADMTGPGLFYRLREAERWLEYVLAQTLAQEVPPAPVGWRLRVIDATVITGPGSKGTDWRAHVVVDPASGQFRAVELTDASGGEGYTRHRIAPGDVVLGDRAYATARGLLAVQDAGGTAIARLNPHTIRLCSPARTRWAVTEVDAAVPAVGALDVPVAVPVPPKAWTKRSHGTWRLKNASAWITARVIGARTRDGEVIWVITTASATEIPALRILELYRLRWQIELCFKRLKTLLHLDTLPTREGPTAKSWLLARFLAAALAQRLVQPAGPLSPWGYELRADLVQA